MREDEHLLVVLAEEASEVSKCATKALRFGLLTTQSGEHYNNYQRLVLEVIDLLAALRMVREQHGFTEMDTKEFEYRLDLKIARIREWLEVSYRLGTIT